MPWRSRCWWVARSSTQPPRLHAHAQRALLGYSGSSWPCPPLSTPSTLTQMHALMGAPLAGTPSSPPSSPHACAHRPLSPHSSLRVPGASAHPHFPQPAPLAPQSLRGLRDWKQLDMFQREAGVLASLDHPGIPKCGGGGGAVLKFTFTQMPQLYSGRAGPHKHP